MRGLPSASILLVMVQLAAQAPTCRLEGQVVDPMRNPVRGALVAAEHDGVVVARTSTDADGLFVFGKLPQDRVRLVATSRDPEVGALWTDLLEAKQHFVHVTTMPARAVYGTVTDAHGAPLANAFVVAFPTAGGRFGSPATTTNTDAAGRYRLPHVPMGSGALRIYARDCAPYDATLDGDQDVEHDAQLGPTDREPFTFTLPAPSADLDVAFTVRSWSGDEYVPLPPWFREPRFVAGTLTLPDVAHGDLLEVSVDPALPVEPRRHLAIGGRARRAHDFEALQGDAAVVHLKFAGIHPPRPLRALLQEVDDQGLPARREITVPIGGELKVPAMVPAGTVFAVRLLDAKLCARGEGAPGWYEAVHQPGSVHTVTARPAQSLRLRIVTADGTPCAGAAITYRGIGRANRVPTHLLGGTGQTDARGEATLRGMQTIERHWIEVHHGLGYLTEMLPPDLETQADLGTLTLNPGGEVLIRSVDADGRPAPGTRVLLHRAGEPWRALCTDRTGHALCTGLEAAHFATQRLPDGELSAWTELPRGGRIELVVEVRR